MARRSVIVMLCVLGASCSLFTSESEGKSGPCPTGMVHITRDEGAFCIDKWEASIEDHAPFEPVTGLKVKAVSRAGVIPQGYISKNEAEAACKASRKRLCTSEEWLYACRGKKPTKFPYGDDRKEGYCNDSGRAPIASLHPELQGDEIFASNAAMNDPRINQSPNTVAKTGSHAKCKNAFGVFDMVGNLHEWTSEINGARGVFRGGYYQDTHINGDGCSYKTDAHAPSYHDYSTGFRCCK